MYSSTVEGLVSSGSQFYAAKKFEEAVEKYAEACQEQAKEKGSDDADLLFLYGKALFQNAVSKSEVLGGTEGNDDENEDDEAEKVDESFQFNEGAEEVQEESQEKKNRQETRENDTLEPEEGEVDPEDGEIQQEDQSDFEVAWEILDLTRTLFEEELEKLPAQEPAKLMESEKEPPSDEVTALLKKVADVYDLLGEVSLEGENFQGASDDLAKSLELREKLYVFTSSMISEAHYKLSLALEFAVEKPDNREKAVKHTELALKSIKEKGADEDNDIILDMELRLAELRKDPAKQMDSDQVKMLQTLIGDKVKDATAINDLTAVTKKRKGPSSKGEKKVKR